jgi:hypothetical protein
VLVCCLSRLEPTVGFHGFQLFDLMHKVGVAGNGLWCFGVANDEVAHMGFEYSNMCAWAHAATCQLAALCDCCCLMPSTHHAGWCGGVPCWTGFVVPHAFNQGFSAAQWGCRNVLCSCSVIYVEFGCVDMTSTQDRVAGCICYTKLLIVGAKRLLLVCRLARAGLLQLWG